MVSMEGLGPWWRKGRAVVVALGGRALFGTRAWSRSPLVDAGREGRAGTLNELLRPKSLLLLLPRRLACDDGGREDFVVVVGSDGGGGGGGQVDAAPCTKGDEVEVIMLFLVMDDLRGG